MIGSLFSLIWSIVVLTVCMHIQIPNSSFFPEIDFASKCVGNSEGDSSSMENLLYPLSNPTSGVIRRRLTATRFFVGVRESDTELNHIEMNPKEQLGSLIKGQKYT